MNLNEVKEVIYDLFAGFFQGATVVWAEQSGTTPTFPYITLKSNGIGRKLFKDGSPQGCYYHCNTTLQINLYTQGKAITDEHGVYAAYINTAVSDLHDFTMYLDSPAIIDRLCKKGITILLNGEIRDLSDLKNDGQYRYRAYAEMDITFSQKAEGLYGLQYAKLPNSSGGGVVEMTEELPDIEKVIINQGGIEYEE